MIMFLPSRQLYSFHIRGFQYWDGALVVDKLKVGNKLKLRIEPENPHDPHAVAVYRGSSKLGYVPADMNEALSTMLFYGHKKVFEARVMQVDPEAEPWKQVRMGIFIVDNRG